MRSEAEPKDAPATFLVEGMSCSHCEAAVSAAVGEVAGVESVEVDLAGGVVSVRGTGITDDAVYAAIEGAGYEVSTA